VTAEISHRLECRNANESVRVSHQALISAAIAPGGQVALPVPCDTFSNNSVVQLLALAVAPESDEGRALNAAFIYVERVLLGTRCTQPQRTGGLNLSTEHALESPAGEG
jgi:hypothetical protein